VLNDFTRLLHGHVIIVAAAALHNAITAACEGPRRWVGSEGLRVARNTVTAGVAMLKNYNRKGDAQTVIAPEA